jgi:hypothetical protein
MRLWVLVGWATAAAAGAAACGAFGSDENATPAAAGDAGAESGDATAVESGTDRGPRDPVGPARDLTAGQQTPGPIVIDSTSVYWINLASGGKPGAVMKMPKGGGTPITLTPSLVEPYALTADATRLYFSENDSGLQFSFQNLYLQDKAGGNAKRLQLNANDQVFGCSAQGGAVFWILQSNGGQVGLVETDSWTSTSVMPIASNLGAVKTVAASTSDVFIGGAGELLQVTRVGAVKSVFATTVGAVKALVFDAPIQTLFWADTVSIHKRIVGSLDGPVMLAGGQNGPTAIAVDANNVYWTNAGDGTVQRAPKEGGPTTPISSGESEPLGIAVDDTGVYWTNRGDGRVRFYPR